MTTAAPDASAAETLPDVPGTPDGGNTSGGSGSLFGRFFFPVVFILLAIWGVSIATGDAVPKPEFDPAEEFNLDQSLIAVADFKLGGVEVVLDINKGVIYLLIAMTLCILLAVYVNRRIVPRLRQESHPQSAIELMYEFAHDQIATLIVNDETDPLFRRYMPYVASLFFFIWFLNITSFLPLPLNTSHNFEAVDWLPSLGIYAVTSNIFCTFVLALATFAIYHFEGVKAHGFVGYLKTWTAGQTGFAGAFVFVIEVLTNLVLKPVSLAVRLFANMLSGHVLILLMLALSGIIAGGLATTIVAQVGGTVVAIAFYLFEVGLIATLQAFIFAALSAIYIGQAAAEHH